MTATNNFIFSEDLNELPTFDFETVLGIIQIVRVPPTRGNATLDKIFVKTGMRNNYNSRISPLNLRNSDHTTILLKPK